MIAFDRLLSSPVAVVILLTPLGVNALPASDEVIHFDDEAENFSYG